MIDVLGTLTESGLDLHTSIVLTYSVDLVLYDSLIRRRFRQAGAVNQMVFCDLRKYQEQLDGLSVLRRFGRSYSVTPVHQAAAFHPKLYMLLGRKGGRLVIGSGNATIGGLFRNAEAFGVFEYDRGRDPGPHPAFRECFQFVEQLSRDGAEVVKRQVARARSWSPWLETTPVADHRTVLFGGPGRQAILEQVVTAIGENAVRSALVCTASVDRQLAALRELAALTKNGRLQCVVQPGQIQLDGQAVRRLGKVIEWKPFVDPYPKEKKKRRDVFAHAKVVVFDCGDREVLVYGSANASKPAILEAGGNSEIVVRFDPWRRGTTVKRLGLDRSLKARDIAKELGEQTWDESEEDSPAHALALTAAVPTASGVVVHVAGGDMPDGTFLELHEGLARPALLRGKVTAQTDGFLVRVREIPDNVRIARLVGPSGQPLSNAVGLTWPEVATVQSSSGVDARTEAALGAMQDGTLLGTVLFELLDQVRDFEVVRGRGSPSGFRKRKDDDSRPEDRNTDSFYTDAAAGEAKEPGWIGDRTDLDLLAAMVQPIQAESPGKKRSSDNAEEADDLDDSVLDEEIERREIDAKKGRATGGEKSESPNLTSTQALERASNRLLKRLDRAATAAEKALAQRRELATVPPVALARQIWMAHIAAFLAGREALSSDGEDVLCLEPVRFAEYVLRVCRALAGGKDGGLLSLVSEKAFAGPDGDSLKRGMAFLWTCAIFAVAEIADYWENSPLKVDDEDEDDVEYAADVCDAAPELVAARFVLAVRSHCRRPDAENVAKRLPAWNEWEEGWFEEWKGRIDRLASLIKNFDTSGAPPSKPDKLPLPGDLVYHPVMGVTVLMRSGDSGKCYLLDLSRADPERPENVNRAFLPDQVRAIPAPDNLGGWVWREPGWQVQ